MSLALGYQFYPPTWGHSLGHPRLDVRLGANPSQVHYDPEKADFAIVGLDGGRERLTVTYGWQGAKSYRACLGRIMLHDRANKLVQAFSFGGQLTIQNEESCTLSILTSTAPILDLIAPDALNARLVSGFEALLARLEARSRQAHFLFMRRVVSLDPQTLFMAGLASLTQSMAQIPPALRYAHYQEEKRAIEEVIVALQKQGQWPDNPPGLEALLGSA